MYLNKLFNGFEGVRESSIGKKLSFSLCMFIQDKIAVAAVVATQPKTGSLSGIAHLLKLIYLSEQRIRLEDGNWESLRRRFRRPFGFMREENPTALQSQAWLRFTIRLMLY